MSGAQVKAIRDRLGLTQVQFAELLHVTQTAVSCWEGETRRVTPAMAELIRLKEESFRSYRPRRGRAASPAA